MLRPFLFACLFLLPWSFSAQNALLELYHPFYKSLVALRTDSLFIRTYEPNMGTLERQIRFFYSDDETLAPDWTEIRDEKNGSRLWRIQQRHSFQDDMELAETEMFDSITAISTKDRSVIFRNKDGQIDSILNEKWESDFWKPAHRSVFRYSADLMLESRTESQMDGASEDWVDEFNSRWRYDGQKRVIQRIFEIPGDTGWRIQNLYTYQYHKNERLPSASVWASSIDSLTLTPIDSTTVWYDEDGLEDSSRVYFWNQGNGHWMEVSRRILTDEEQKTAQQGLSYLPDATGKWTEREEIGYVPGEQIFTTEPSEETVRVFDPASGQWKDHKRKTINYQKLDSLSVRGVIQISEWDETDQDWKETFYAEAWFTLDQQRPAFDSTHSRNNQLTLRYICGLPNPYIRNMRLQFPESTAQGDYELMILSEEGRLVYRQKYDDSGVGFVDAVLQPGFYIVTVSRGNTPLCTQKLIVQF